MERNREKLAKEWFKKAEDDELSCRDILEDCGGAPSTVCFLSQQMSEKYLKGFLVHKGERFPKIHQLDRLVKLCEKIDISFKKLKGDAGFLSAFYITARYPGDFPEFNFKDANDAFKKALKIKEFVLGKIP